MAGSNDRPFLVFQMKIKIPLQIIELETGNYHLIAQGIFLDKTVIHWVIDTGASKSVFDKNLTDKYTLLDEETEEIHSAGIGEKPLETRIGKLMSFKLGKLKITNQKMAILDLAHINNLYSKTASLTIGGLIGGDFLLKHQAIIDYKRKVIILK